MLKELQECAVAAALEGGKILREGFGSSFTIKSKSDRNDLVTEYDHKSEIAIINFIKSRYSDHKFLAEESGLTGNTDEVITWVIDPLDGTVNYAHSLPIFSVSIAAVKNNEILCAAVYQPILDELFTATKGQGAMLNNQIIKPSSSKSLESSFLVTGFPYNVHKNPGHCVEHFIGMIRQGIPIRRLGSAALDLAYVACGRFDGFWEVELKPWDVAAGVLILSEAGGKVTQYNKDEYWITDDNMLATNGLIHEQLSETLMSCYLEFSSKL